MYGPFCPIFTEEKHTYTHTLTVPCRFHEGLFSKIVVFFLGKYREKVQMASPRPYAGTLKKCPWAPGPKKWHKLAPRSHFQRVFWRVVKKRFWGGQDTPPLDTHPYTHTLKTHTLIHQKHIHSYTHGNSQFEGNLDPKTDLRIEVCV